MPTSNESDYQGNTKVIDVDMNNDELFPLACNMRTTCSFTCVVDNDDISFRMLCPKMFALFHDPCIQDGEQLLFLMHGMQECLFDCS
jgi:hypothetical protein